GTPFPSSFPISLIALSSAHYHIFSENRAAEAWFSFSLLARRHCSIATLQHRGIDIRTQAWQNGTVFHFARRINLPDGF
ncbi:MAG: hypothetical protein LBH09_06415, partial [Peptococcaceae bacterium]|nr:hypothetical protein [Peptococcaceae bacterium]